MVESDSKWNSKNTVLDHVIIKTMLISICTCCIVLNCVLNLLNYISYILLLTLTMVPPNGSAVEEKLLLQAGSERAHMGPPQMHPYAPLIAPTPTACQSFHVAIHILQGAPAK